MRKLSFTLFAAAILISCFVAPIGAAHDGQSRLVYAGPGQLGYATCAPDFGVNPLHCGTDDGVRVRVTVWDAFFSTVPFGMPIRFTWELHCNTPEGTVLCDTGEAEGEADFATPPSSAFVRIALQQPYTSGTIDFLWYHGS